MLPRVALEYGQRSCAASTSCWATSRETSGTSAVSVDREPDPGVRAAQGDPCGHGGDEVSSPIAVATELSALPKQAA